MRIKDILTKSVSFAKDHKRLLCTIGECVGVCALAYSSSRNGYRTAVEIQAKDIVEPKEKMAITLKNHVSTYFWLVVIGACIAAKEKVTMQELSAMALAYSELNRKHDNYRVKANEIFGSDADDKIQHAIVQEHIQNNIPVAGEQSIVVYDTMMECHFNGTYNKIRIAELELNKLYHESGHATMRDFYEMLGIVDGLPKHIQDKLDDYGWDRSLEDDIFGNLTAINFANTFYDDVHKQMCVIECEYGPFEL